MDGMAALAEAPPNADTRFFEADLADSDELAFICGGADYVFHLAALADIVPSTTNPVEYHRCNVEGTVHLLEAVRTAGGRSSKRQPLM